MASCLCTRCRWPPRHSSAHGCGGAFAFPARAAAAPRVMLVTLVWLLLPLFAALPLMLAGTTRAAAVVHACVLRSRVGPDHHGLHGDERAGPVAGVRQRLAHVLAVGWAAWAFSFWPSRCCPCWAWAAASCSSRGRQAGEDAKLTPRMTGTAKGLWGCMRCFRGLRLAYWLGGMAPLDA